MKYSWLFILLLMVLSCSKIIDKPKNLLTEEQMANIMADFAINDQGFVINSTISQEESTKFVMKKHKIKGEDFMKSYEYYITDEKKMNDILDKTQEIILNKDPKGQEYINKKLKEAEQSNVQN